MFSLMQGFYEMYTKKNEYKIIMIGCANAGKTTLLEQMKKLEGLNYSKRIIPTIGLNIAKI